MNWHDDESNLTELAVYALCNRKMIRPTCCDNPDVHVYGYRYRQSWGSAWAWCSHCGAFVHLDGISISDYWENDSSIDFYQLTAVPKYLDSKREVVDKHFKEYMMV